MNPVLLQAATRPGLDPWQLILDATPVVKVVLMVLVLMALVCWYIIGAKLVRLRKVRAQSRRFLRSGLTCYSCKRQRKHDRGQDRCGP